MKAKKKKTAKTAKVRKVADRNDITELMIEHHKPLKKLIKVMKKSESGMAKLKDAFQSFAPLLEGHAKPEERALYGFMERDSSDLRVEGFEGHTEHHIADELVHQIKNTRDEDEWKARVKVLAELVEHHIEEEEEEMIPDLRKELELETRIEIGEEYMRLRERFALETEAA